VKPSVSAEQAAALVVEHAKALGFHRVGIVPVQTPNTMQAYESWLAAGYAGSMEYMSSADHVNPRRDPSLVLSGAKTMIVVALAYSPDPATQRRRLPMSTQGGGPLPGPTVRYPDDALRGQIARYAAGEDYHIVMRDRLYALSRYIHDLLGAEVACRPCVDSAPVLERDVAALAGIGFVAKNTMVIAPGLGSYFVLGELLLDIELAPTSAPSKKTHCGTCTACIDACPTGAFVDAYLLDARKCISYLTIEHRGSIAHELRPLMGTWIFGCDICQQVCPYNAGSGESLPPALPQRDIEHVLPDLVRLVTFGANQLRHFVKRTAMRRAPREQILRNVAIALGNSGDVRAWAPLRQLLTHRHPLVRSHAAWGLGRLAGLAPMHGMQHQEEMDITHPVIAQALTTDIDPACLADLALAANCLQAAIAAHRE
jgi:epoxyqueuosine reductase